MKRNLTSRRLQLETLEERTLLAVTAGAEQALLPAAADTVSLSKNTGETIDLSREKALTTESDYITGKTVPFNGSYQDLAEIDKGATWVMYSADGEDWDNEMTFRNAGSYTFYVWAGDDDGYEELAQVTGTITPLQLTVEGSYVENHAYDGTTDAVVAVGTATPLYDNITVTAAGQFASAEIGTWDVAVSYTVSGEMAGNYYAPADETLTGRIWEQETASMHVTTADDVVDPTDGLISLREALTVYFGTDECLTVTFAEGLTAISADSTFTLESSHNGLLINGADTIIFDGVDFSLFTMTSCAEVTFTGLTFQNISSDDFGGAFKTGWGCQTGEFPTVTFDKCSFLNNSGGAGSALMFTGLNAVITDCYFYGNHDSSYGTIWDCWGNLTVENCIFENNSANGRGGVIIATADSGYTVRVSGSTFTENRAGGDGGAIFSEMKNLIITDSVFTNNSSSGAGGAVTTPDAANTSDNIVVSGCEFTGNTAEGDGGALRVYNYNGNTLTLSDSTFANNSSNAAGGAIQLTGCTYAIDGCTFTENTASGSFNCGGAIHISYGGVCSVSNSVFQDNIATGSYAGKGGAIHFINQNGEVTVTNSSFTGNQAYAPDYYYAWGGAICRESGTGTLNFYNCSITGNSAIKEGSTDPQSTLGGGIFMNDGGVINLVQCLVAENEAVSDSCPSYGGGIYLGVLGCTIWYSSITNNTTSGTSNSVGAGIFNSGATTILGSIICGNTVPEDNLWEGAGADIWQGGVLAFNYSLYDETAILVPSEDYAYTADEYCYPLQEGDILFAEGGYSLADDSVAIDGTNVTTVPFPGTLGGLDLAGNNRLVNKTVDYGAFEYQGGAQPAEQLDAPTILTGNRGFYVSHGANRHQITWDAVENASAYGLAYSADGSSWTTISVSDTSAVITGLTYGTNMQYRVRALGTGSYANSEWSPVKTFNVCPMDINNDGDISSGDRAFLAASWLAEEGEEEYTHHADIDGNGDISGSDRVYLAANWLMDTEEEGLRYPASLAADAVFAEFASADPDAGPDVF